MVRDGVCAFDFTLTLLNCEPCHPRLSKTSSIVAVSPGFKNSLLRMTLVQPQSATKSLTMSGALPLLLTENVYDITSPWAIVPRSTKSSMNSIFATPVLSEELGIGSTISFLAVFSHESSRANVKEKIRKTEKTLLIIANKQLF